MRPRSILIIAAAIILCIGAFFYLKAGVTVIDYSGRLDGLLSGPLSKFGVTKRAVTRESRTQMRRGIQRYIHVYREYALDGVRLQDLAKALDEGLKKTPFRALRRDYKSVKDSEELYYAVGFKGMNLLSMGFREKRRVRPAARKRRLAGPRIAVVLDDFGNNRENIETLFGIGIPVTFSILPNLPYSRAIANEAHARGYEVILHLPLEPQRKDVKEEAKTINSRLPPDEVVSRLNADIESVPHVVGVSNHMGSQSTEEAGLMEIIFKELKSRGLFFLDSLVTERSVCEAAARKVGIRYAKRDVFLDNTLEEGYIREQIYNLKEAAAKAGSCIAIGHDRRMTVRVLKEALPELERDGFRFVTVSELAK
jgi:polysaccharide deacetylase 2 family uncharacterized protein YibQ